MFLHCLRMSLQLWQHWNGFNATIMYERSKWLSTAEHIHVRPLWFFHSGRVANTLWCVINFLQSYRNVTKHNLESLQWVKKYFIKWIYHYLDSHCNNVCVHLKHTCTYCTLHTSMYNPELINSLWLCWTTSQSIVLEIIFLIY